MQVSEMFRRGVIAPRSDEAERQLRSCFVSSDIDVDVVPIDDSDAIFHAIGSSGIFDAINAACGSAIDDYEEEILEPQQLPAAIATVDNMAVADASGVVVQFRSRLLQLMRESEARKRPVMFVL